MKTCPNCNGRTTVNFLTCGRCRGNGVVRKLTDLERYNKCNAAITRILTRKKKAVLVGMILDAIHCLYLDSRARFDTEKPWDCDTASNVQGALMDNLIYSHIEEASK